MSENFQDTDRCGECPDNPKNREYLQQRGVSVSGIDGRPKSNPVLEAIDNAVQPESGGITTEQHNEMLGDIRAAYLQNHPQRPEVAGRTTSYYICPQCKMPIDMTGTGLDRLVASGDGGEFERAIATLYPDGDYHGAIHRITAAHNAARAADKRRIAELEAQIDGMKAMAEVYGKVMSRINKSCEAAGCRQGEDMADFIEGLGTRIAELELQLTLALKQRDCESGRSSKRMDEIVELRDQLASKGGAK